MIAVFARNEKEFRLNFGRHTSNLLKHVTRIRDVRGCNFTGLIETFDWHHCDSAETKEAYEIVRQRQPELFK